MPPAEHQVDLLVIGSGAAGMTAAAVAAAEGLRPMVVEKTGAVGGTTAISGGMVWIPCDEFLRSGGEPDSEERARRYLDAVVDDDDGRDMRERFLEAGPRAVAYLARRVSRELVARLLRRSPPRADSAGPALQTVALELAIDGRGRDAEQAGGLARGAVADA